MVYNKTLEERLNLSDKMNNMLGKFMKKFKVGASLGSIDNDDRIRLLQRTEKRLDTYFEENPQYSLPDSEKHFTFVDKYTVSIVAYIKGKKVDLSDRLRVNELSTDEIKMRVEAGRKMDSKLSGFIAKFGLSGASLGKINDDNRLTLLDRTEKQLDTYLNENPEYSLPDGEKHLSFTGPDEIALIAYIDGERVDLTEKLKLNKKNPPVEKKSFKTMEDNHNLEPKINTEPAMAPTHKM